MRIISMIFFLISCSSTTTENDVLSKTETIIENAHDDAKLIAFYKQNMQRMPEYMLKLVNIYLNQEDTASAKIYIDMLSADKKGTPDALYSIARMHYYDQELDAASQQIERLKEITRRDPEVYLLAGKIYAGKGKFTLAKQNFQDALRLGYEDKMIKNNLALLHMMQGEYGAAIRLLTPLYKANPEDQTVESNLLVAVINHGDISMARSILTNRYGSDVAEQNLTLLMKSKTKNKSESPVVNDRVELPVAGMYKQNFMEYEKPVETTNRMPLVNPIIKSNNLDSRIFRVQIFASNEEISAIQLERFKKYKTDIYFYNFSFWKRYCIGAFATLQEARVFKEHLNAKGSFVVEYSNTDYKIIYDYAS